MKQKYNLNFAQLRVTGINRLITEMLLADLVNSYWNGSLYLISKRGVKTYIDVEM